MKNRLKVLRAERDWSQQDLADQLGVSRQSVNAIEKGRYDPSLPLAFKIADVFALTIEEIFERGCPARLHRKLLDLLFTHPDYRPRQRLGVTTVL